MLHQLSKYYISKAAIQDDACPLGAPVDLLHLCAARTAHLKQLIESTLCILFALRKRIYYCALETRSAAVEIVVADRTIWLDHDCKHLSATSMKGVGHQHHSIYTYDV